MLAREESEGISLDSAELSSVNNIEDLESAVERIVKRGGRL